MKKIASLVLILALTQGCKKEDTSNHVPAPDNGAPPVVYTYNVSLINDRTDDTVGDTLIIKINDVVKLKQMGAGVTKATDFKCKSGDKFYVYYNPGTAQYSGSTIKQSNKLILYPDGGNMNPVSFNGCRCTGERTIVLN